jgi:prepilin-type N-terminal cleavage/methylation domain-containing protein
MKISNIKYQISNIKSKYQFSSIGNWKLSRWPKTIEDPVWKLPSGEIGNSRGGFTLIELLVSLFILSTISSLVLGIIWVSLRSTVKVNNMNLIRQNGNFAITQMAKMIQFGKQFQGVSSDGTTYTQTCQAPGTSPLQTYNYVSFTASDDGDIVLGCLQSPSTIASNSASLINTNTFTVTSCSFTCTQTSDSPYTIGIQFTIEKKVSGNLFDQPSPLFFQTSATMRNISQ